MIIFKINAAVHDFIIKKKKTGITTGLVPTMGALHNGHLALLNKARLENELVVCSLFINPTQFNDPGDFERYPVTIENDIYLLEKAGCDVLFIPAVKEIYPGGFNLLQHYDLGYLETILEGKFRLGHFQGVCQVVHRLLDIILPDKIYLGQKDLQQCMVIKKMVELQKIKTEIVICATQREPDGLAMSSRNLRLSEAGRAKAPAIYAMLKTIKNELVAGNVENIKLKAFNTLTEKGFKVDYVEIADAASLELVTEWNGKKPLAILAAAFIDAIRLIDNIVIDE